MSKLNPIATEILWTRLVGIVDEAAATFVRASFSTLVREANDYAVVLTDRTGRNLAQSSQSIPSFIATLPETVRLFSREFGIESMRPGDVFITNDPWYGTGHLNDATIVAPIFVQDDIVGFAGVVSHLPDIGGRLRNPANRELFEEGLQIPPLRLLHAGEEDKVLIRMIRENVRVPDETMGDIWAMTSCVTSLGLRLVNMLNETEIDLDEFANDIIGRTEVAMRDAIRAAPDGTWAYEIENDGPAELKGGVVVIRATVTISGDIVSVDYEGSSDQVNLAINTVLNYTKAYSAYALKSLFAPWIPNNEGAFLPISITAPEGSILNPLRPAPVGARGMIGHLLPPAIFGALAEPLGERTQAAPGSPSNNIQITSLSGRKRYAINAFLGAGQGGGAGRDGASAVSFPSNLSNTPVEVLENQAPIEVQSRHILHGSGGSGRFRGGDGIGMTFKFRGESSAMASFMINRIKCPAPGLFGGGQGKPAKLEINGNAQIASGSHVLSNGDLVIIETGGGGGFGEVK
ncbi:hydantoinase B/oxoprolinase family protein [Phyllobacterium sp. YR531]|uniref:hydantoinase B/oxoprolinase family protein n=1 Tax=Phyllobacterium sp. YR531 TaxID=1144343 RepID=UPI00026FB1D4|nr:hydantoinase B/oxoprolinase family protein [Phyllobacterium sp. YR531]EJN06737.1 N-methylhydantoinase B/acetone carboxylase, alpha subunit [Phyllobacterium sp. YR531]